MSKYMNGDHNLIHGNKRLITDFLVKIVSIHEQQVKLMVGTIKVGKNRILWYCSIDVGLCWDY